VIVVDTHCHVSHGWYEPVEALIDQMDRNEVQHAVLVQIRGQTNNDYQFECVARYPERFVSVVVIDTDSPNAPRELERLKARGARGVRLWADTRSPGDDPLLIWRAAAELGLPVSCNGSERDLASDEFAAIVEALPELPIIVEHLGGSVRSRHEGHPYEMRRKVFSLSRFPNVYLKIPGLGEFATRAMPVEEPFPFEAPIPPLLDLAHEAFGPARLMWGSDYPPVSGREGYRNALRLPMAHLAARSEEERAQIFGGTAAALFGIP
jgi:L-fuconolactonase